MELPITPEALVPAGAGLLAAALLMFLLLTRGWRPVPSTGPRELPQMLRAAMTLPPSPLPRSGPNGEARPPRPSPAPDHPDARDRLLSVLLADPELALEAVGDLDACNQQLARLNEAVRYQRKLLGGTLRRLLDAGLDSSQVARLAGLDTGEVRSLLVHAAPSATQVRV